MCFLECSRGTPPLWRSEGRAHGISSSAASLVAVPRVVKGIANPPPEYKSQKIGSAGVDTLPLPPSRLSEGLVNSVS